MDSFRDFPPAELSEIVGKTMESVYLKGENPGEYEEMYFLSDDGKSWVLAHCYDCCENVVIEDVCGDLDDLIDSPILQAEQVSSEDPGPPPGYNGSYTWTFYKFATIKGSVTVRWLGTSNGYYSESVDFRACPEKDS